VAIAWSGLIVLAALATMLLVDSRAIRTAGLGMMLVTLAAVVAASWPHRS
jgi:RND superfamily putative drug exporter